MIQADLLSTEEMASLRSAAVNGDPESMYLLAKCYEAGRLPASDSEGRDFWLRKFLASDTVSALLGEMASEKGTERFSGCPETEDDWHSPRIRELAACIRDAEACLAQ